MPRLLIFQLGIVEKTPILHSISAACVAISVESIDESLVSIYETRQTKSRTLSDDRANYEMQIGYNGPDLAKADTML